MAAYLLVFCSALGLVILASPPFINWCTRRFQAPSREYAPSHHQKKNNTPVMGGLLIIGSALIAVLCSLVFDTSISIVTSHGVLAVMCLFCFAAIGFVDDWAKVHAKRGMTAKQKFIAQWGCALGIATLWYTTSNPNAEIFIPLLGFLPLPSRLLLIPWAAFVIVATSNAVNLTDGLDGLASSTLSVVFACFAIIAYMNGYISLALASCALSGATLGFLWCNAHPALIFMGDTGSLSLGATLGFIAIATRYEFFLPIAGVVFVGETLSVMLQVASFKLRGKRIFRMAPLHHHFELAGWPETRITTRALIVTVVGTMYVLIAYKHS